MPEWAIQYQLGHKSIRTTVNHYLLPDVQTVKGYVDAVAKAHSR